MDLRTAILASATLAFTALAGCLGGGEVDEVRLGVLVPLTGDLAAFGPSGLNAVKLCAAQFNEAGGVLDGAEIRVVQADSQTDPSKTPQEMNRLVNVDQVHAVIGAYASSETLSVWRIAADNDLPLVTPASTSPTLTDVNDNDLVFRVPPSDELQAKVMAELLQDDGVEKISVIAINNDYGTGFERWLSEYFEDAGGEVAASVVYDPQGTVFDTVVDEAAEADPEAVVLIAYPATGGTIMSTAFQKGFTEDFDWYFSEGVFDSQFIGAAGEDQDGNSVVAGFKGTTPQGFTPEGLPTAADFSAAYEEEFGGAPALFGAEAYDACVLLLLAMEEAGSVEGNEVAAALHTVATPPGANVTDPLQALERVQAGDDINYNGASGEVDWDANGDPVVGVYATWTVNEDGEIEILQTKIRVA